MQVPSVRPSIVTETAVGEIASSQGIRAGRQCVLVFFFEIQFPRRCFDGKVYGEVPVPSA